MKGLRGFDSPLLDLCEDIELKHKPSREDPVDEDWADARPSYLRRGSLKPQHGEVMTMKTLDRITIDPEVMGGKACIRGLRVTVGTVVGLLAAGRSPAEILDAYPYLEREDIDQALAYAAWRLEEHEVPLSTP